MADLPSGAVTFLLTDIEGSTQLVKQLRDRYPEVLAEHQRILREAFAERGGYEIDTQGDAFFVAFASARDAVLAAVSAQRTLAQHAWPEGTRVKVRIGIHTGQATPVDGRYSGVAVHRAARISAAGHGGQILISQTAHNLLEDEEEELPGVALRNLGEHQLKDLDRPVRLYQVYADGLDTEFPSLRTEAPVPAAAPEARYPRRRTILIGALAGVLAAAVAIPIFAFGGGSSSTKTFGDHGEAGVGVIDPAAGTFEGAIETPAAPAAVAAGLGYVWAASADTNAVYAIDPGTGTVHDTIAVGGAPGALAVGLGSVWATNSLDGTVSQISPSTGEVVPITVGNGPSGVDVGDGFVWVANTIDHTVSKIDPIEGTRLEDYAVGPDPGAVAFGEGALWVASKSGGTVLKLSPEGEILKVEHVGDGPGAVDVGGGAVWVANGLSGTVSKLDPTTGNEIDTIEVGGSPSGITVLDGSVWVANELADTVSKIDPSTGDVTAIPVDGRPTSVAANGGGVYVSLRPTGLAHRGGTLNVSLGKSGPVTVDTAVAYDADDWRVLVLTNDSLVTYRRVGGQEGYQLVPDLASSMPTVSADGKTYTFQLRRGIHYSDGRPVRASDVRSSIERVFKIRPHTQSAATDNFRAIRGARQCSQERCDLSHGVVTDDDSGTVTIHLSAPDPIFLLKLASPFASVLPAGTTVQEAKRRPLPATGPYRIASVDQQGSIRLVRNPRFREWSSEAQPAGYPDEIVFKHTGSAKKRIRLVARGKADVTSSSPQSPFPVPATLRSHLHVYPQPIVFYLALNPTKPPFDDVRARRAFNYAVDRARVVRIGPGEDAARPTCQVLPPSFPGYRPYCPYTLDPNDEGNWTAPDVARATELARASGRAPVTLWFPPGIGGARVGRYLVSVLESLGYRVRPRFIKDGDAYFNAIYDPKTSPQVAWGAWGPDYPAASNFLQLLLSCRTLINTAHFCDRAIDRQMNRALKLQRSDPAAANRLWADIDRNFVDKAAWVPLYNTYGADLVSRRVSNYQYHPQWGALLSQMWVR